MELSSQNVLKLVKEQMECHIPFTARDIKGIPEDEKAIHSVQNSLWRLSKQGYLAKCVGKGSRGKYTLRQRRVKNGAPVGVIKKKKTQSSVMSPAKAVYDLLEFMAKAEESLLRAARVLDALEELK